MTSIVTGMGSVSVAANYVAVQTESICYLPAYGVAAATALVGQSIGAGRTGVWATMSVELVLRGIFFLIRLMKGRWIHTHALN